jgi:hypothetical protein
MHVEDPVPAAALAVLGLDSGADHRAVACAYRRLALRTHPDVCDAPDAAQRFDAVVRAYHFLLDAAGTGRAVGASDSSTSSALRSKWKVPGAEGMPRALLLDPGVATVTTPWATAPWRSSQVETRGAWSGFESVIVAGPVRVDPSLRAPEGPSFTPGPPGARLGGGRW